MPGFADLAVASRALRSYGCKAQREPAGLVRRAGPLMVSSGHGRCGGGNRVFGHAPSMALEKAAIFAGFLAAGAAAACVVVLDVMEDEKERRGGAESLYRMVSESVVTTASFSAFICPGRFRRLAASSFLPERALAARPQLESSEWMSAAQGRCLLGLAALLCYTFLYSLIPPPRFREGRDEFSLRP